LRHVENHGDGDDAIYPIQAIISAVNEYYRVRRNDFMSNRRFAIMARARHVCFWLAYRHTPRTFTEIGRLCKKDHSTVMYGAAKVGREMHKHVDDIAKIKVIIERLVRDEQQASSTPLLEHR
jgi:chromosomal replication initiation ATPase DnaA